MIASRALRGAIGASSCITCAKAQTKCLHELLSGDMSVPWMKILHSHDVQGRGLLWDVGTHICSWKCYGVLWHKFRSYISEMFSCVTPQLQRNTQLQLLGWDASPRRRISLHYHKSKGSWMLQTGFHSSKRGMWCEQYNISYHSLLPSLLCLSVFFSTSTSCRDAQRTNYSLRNKVLQRRARYTNLDKPWRATNWHQNPIYSIALH